MRSFLLDLRTSLRALRRDPGFTVLVVALLALGIGGNTIIFSVVNAVLLRPLPFADPERLVLVWDVSARPGSEPTSFNVSPLNYFSRKEGLRTIEGSGALLPLSFVLTGREIPLRVEGGAVSADLLPTLGVEVAAGRNILPEEEGPGGARVAILGHRLWTRIAGGDPGFLGTSLTLNGEPHTVVGILPADFRFPGDPELLVPLDLDPADTSLDQRRFHVLITPARLRARATLAEARAELASLAERLAREYPDSNGGWGATAVPLREQLLGEARARLLALQLAAAFVLLIAAANIANLLLVRAERRTRQLALRAALGAGRQQLAQPLLAEGMLLSLAGGATGLALAALTARPLAAMSPLADTLSAQQVRMDGRAFGFAVAVTLLVGLCVGLVPLARTSRTRLSELLREGGRSAGGVRWHRVLDSLAVAEVAMAALLLVAAGLMVRSFQRLTETDLGFVAGGGMAMRLTLPAHSYAQPRRRIEFVQRLIERVEAIPGVEAAGTATHLPLSYSRMGTFTLEGRPPASSSDVIAARYALVSPGALETLGIPLVKGRGLTLRDGADAPGVVLISESMARTYWPGEDPIGKRIQRGREPDPGKPWLQVVGVVGDVKTDQVNEAMAPAYYLPYAQHAASDVAANFSLVIRTAVDPGGGLAAAIQREIWEIDPQMPVDRVASLEEIVSRSLSGSSFSTFLITLFASLALLLATLGIYGVMSYFVGQRNRELGVRLALGAIPGDLSRLVLLRGLLLTVIGLALGLGAALALTRLLESQLYEVSPFDLPTLSAVGGGLAIVSLVANYLPARRAARIEPAVTLRFE